MSTYTLQQHIDETDVEWSTIQYFKDVVEFLKIKKIKKSVRCRWMYWASFSYSSS